MMKNSTTTVSSAFQRPTAPTEKAILEASARVPRRFDFRRNWSKRIKPLLYHPIVNKCLSLGMKFTDMKYELGDAPWKLGGPPARQPKPGSLAWYQPLHCCHSIAPFAWALGNALYPDLNWGFYSGDQHTVVLGYSTTPDNPEWLFDILLFRTLSSAGAIALVEKQNPQFCDSLGKYVSLFVCLEKREATEPELIWLFDHEDGPGRFAQCLKEYRAA
jgi:hypothetical protein